MLHPPKKAMLPNYQDFFLHIRFDHIHQSYTRSYNDILN